MEVHFPIVILLHVFVKNIFPCPYNRRNLDLFSPGCYDEGTKLHFSGFFLVKAIFCGKKLRLGSTQQNQMVLFLSSSPGGVGTPLTAQTDPRSSSSDFSTPFVGKMPKMGIRERNPMKDTSDSKWK